MNNVIMRFILCFIVCLCASAAFCHASEVNRDHFVETLSADKETMITRLLKYSAKEQHLAFHLEDDVKHYELARNALVLAYDLTTVESPGDHQVSASLVSIVYSRLAWFLYQTNEKWKLDVEDLLKASIKFDNENSIAHYQLGMVYQSKGKPDAVVLEELSHALSIESSFPEAHLQVLLIHVRAGRISASEQSKYAYLDSLERYKPELRFFDNGYPYDGDKIYIEVSGRDYQDLIDRDGNLKRKIFYEDFNCFD